MELRVDVSIIPECGVRATEQRGAGAIEEVICIERIDGKRGRHPANLWIFDSSRPATATAGAHRRRRKLEPWRHRDVLWVNHLVGNARIPSPVPDIGGSGSGVGT